MSAFAELLSRIERPDGVRRLGQALWMMAGHSVDVSALLWACGHLGPDGDLVLWTALKDENCIQGPALALDPHHLSTFLCRLWDGQEGDVSGVRLVWTLPPDLTVEGVGNESYARAAVELVQRATANVTIVSPYLEPRGVGMLQEALLGALSRGASVTILTHDVEDMSSLASTSVESLRREGRGLPGTLTIFTAVAVPQVLLHSKIVAVDSKWAIVGSANVTGKGFGKNLEVGAVLGTVAACEIERVVQSAIAGGLVVLAYATK